MHYHPLGYRLGAGGHGTGSPFDLNKAKSTASVGLLGAANGTKIGDVDAIIQRCPQHLFALLGLDLVAVDSQGDCTHFFQSYSFRRNFANPPLLRQTNLPLLSTNVSFVIPLSVV